MFLINVSPALGFCTAGGAFVSRSLPVSPNRERLGHFSRRNDRQAPTMKVRIGIVGLPNVGKSTLFNALAQTSLAESANYPFCTIEPNVAPVPVPDPYLRRLGQIAGSVKCVPATLEFVDVAGLVRGSHRGEGLGNRFLATVRECDAICHVVRSHGDDDVVHVEGRVDPKEDAELINLELILADLAHVRRRLEKTSCLGEERDALEIVAEALERGVPARAAGLTDAAKFAIKSMGLLTLKPVAFVFNVDEVDFFFGREDALREAEEVVNSLQYGDGESSTCVIVSAKLEAELSLMGGDEQMEYLASLGVEGFDAGSGGDGTEESGNNGEKSREQSLANIMSYSTLPSAAMNLLNLNLAYTGPGVPAERSLTTKAHIFSEKQSPGGLTAEGLAGKLHGTIQRGFIRAEVISASVLAQHSSLGVAKEAGDVRTEGRDYELVDEDVVLVKWKE